MQCLTDVIRSKMWASCNKPYRSSLNSRPNSRHDITRFHVETCADYKQNSVYSVFTCHKEHTKNTQRTLEENTENICVLRYILEYRSIISELASADTTIISCALACLWFSVSEEFTSLDLEPKYGCRETGEEGGGMCLRWRERKEVWGKREEKKCKEILLLNVFCFFFCNRLQYFLFCLNFSTVLPSVFFSWAASQCLLRVTVTNVWEPLV